VKCSCTWTTHSCAARTPPRLYIMAHMFIRWPWSLKLGWTHFYWLWHCCQNLVRPSFAMNPSNFGLVSTFVKMLDRFSAVGMYVTKIFPSSTASQMKWYRRSICLVWEWYLLSFASAITLGYHSWYSLPLPSLPKSPPQNSVATALPSPHVFVRCTQLQC